MFNPYYDTTMEKNTHRMVYVQPTTAVTEVECEGFICVSLGNAKKVIEVDKSEVLPAYQVVFGQDNIYE